MLKNSPRIDLGRLDALKRRAASLHSLIVATDALINAATGERDAHAFALAAMTEAPGTPSPPTLGLDMATASWPLRRPPEKPLARHTDADALAEATAPLREALDAAERRLVELQRERAALALRWRAAAQLHARCERYAAGATQTQPHARAAA